MCKRWCCGEDELGQGHELRRTRAYECKGRFHRDPEGISHNGTITITGYSVSYRIIGVCTVGVRQCLLTYG